MSDYVDTVDIEGTQYDIQDTPTKEQSETNTNSIEGLNNRLTAVETLPPWNTMTNNGLTIRYRKMNHVAFFVITGALTSMIPLGGILFSIPAGYRPTTQEFFAGLLSSVIGLIQIDADGNARNSSGNIGNATMCYSSFSFTVA